METTVGLVGPSSLAESSQELLHRIAPARNPRGWENQLRDEGVFQVSYEYDWRALGFGKATGLGLEVIPHYKAGVGNLSTYVGVGAQVRFGWILADGFGAELPKPGGFRTTTLARGSGPGLELYAGADRKRVFRNLLLDGNTFKGSHRVRREPFTSVFLFGLSARLGRIYFGHEYVIWTRRFRTETRDHAYSSFTLGLFH